MVGALAGESFLRNSVFLRDETYQPASGLISVLANSYLRFCMRKDSVESGDEVACRDVNRVFLGSERPHKRRSCRA